MCTKFVWIINNSTEKFEFSDDTVDFQQVLYFVDRDMSQYCSWCFDKLGRHSCVKAGMLIHSKISVFLYFFLQKLAKTYHK